MLFLSRSGRRIIAYQRGTAHTTSLGLSESAWASRFVRLGASCRSFSTDTKDSIKGTTAPPITASPPDNNTVKTAAADADVDLIKKNKTEEDAKEKLERAKNKAMYEQWAAGPTAYYYRELEAKAVKQGWAIVLRSSMEQYLKMVREKTLSEFASTAPPAVFVRLQNPLLAKYKFDALDFTAGSEAALRSIRAALCSQSLYNYANNISEAAAAPSKVAAESESESYDKTAKGLGKAASATAEAAKSSTTIAAAIATATAKAAGTEVALVDSSSADFLKDVLYPSLYHQCVDALREIKSNGIGFSWLPLDMDVHSTSIVDIDVRMVTKEEYADLKEDNALFVKCAAEEREMMIKHREMLVEYEKMFKAVAANGGGGADTVTENLHQEMLQQAVEPGTGTGTAGADGKGANVDADADGKVGLGQGLPVPSVFNMHFCNSKGNILSLPLFPVGSVVADVKVRFEFTPIPSAAQNTASARKKRESTEWEEFERGKPTAMEWILSACISGHVPLEYKVTSFQAGSDWS